MLSSFTKLFSLQTSLSSLIFNSRKLIHSNNIFKPKIKTKFSKIGDVILTTKQGADVIFDPCLNKGTSFRLAEIERLGIRGLITPRQTSQQEQEERIIQNLQKCKSNIDKYIYLMSLLDRNEILFYKILSKNIQDLAPIIYTPTVGEACLHFGDILRRPRGMYFTSNDKGEMRSMIYNWPTNDVELIVVTDGSRILGLGDLGANGMGIPIGKLCLYTACGGIHPSKCLPVVIDVGTNNKTLRESGGHYLGLNQSRLTGNKYFEIVDEFLSAVNHRYPNALIQFEDFSSNNATKLLTKYRNKYLCFNDDMQGTAVVTLAALLNALYLIHKYNPIEALTKQRIIVVGAGTAGLGVSQGILFNMINSGGITEEEAYKNFYIVDNQGCLGAGRNVQYFFQKPWVRNDIPDKTDLLSLIREVKPTILLGLTGIGGLFKEEIIKEIAKYCKRPIIFPMSNPTKNAECTAQQAIEWTNGRCIFASGSPFKSVNYNGKMYSVSQSNNMYAFPGIGLGALVSQATTITDNMLNQAAIALANSTRKYNSLNGQLFPSISKIPLISKDIAVALGMQAIRDGVSTAKKIKTRSDLVEAVNNKFWIPKYGNIVRIDPMKL